MSKQPITLPAWAPKEVFINERRAGGGYPTGFASIEWHTTPAYDGVRYVPAVERDAAIAERDRLAASVKEMENAECPSDHLLPDDLKRAIHAAEGGPLNEDHVRTLLWHLRRDASEIAQLAARVAELERRCADAESFNSYRQRIVDTDDWRAGFAEGERQQQEARAIAEEYRSKAEAERDRLAARVAELERERDRWRSAAEMAASYIDGSSNASLSSIRKALELAGEK